MKFNQHRSSYYSLIYIYIEVADSLGKMIMNCIFLLKTEQNVRKLKKKKYNQKWDRIKKRNNNNEISMQYIKQF